MCFRGHHIARNLSSFLNRGGRERKGKEGRLRGWEGLGEMNWGEGGMGEK